MSNLTNSPNQSPKEYTTVDAISSRSDKKSDYKNIFNSDSRLRCRIPKQIYVRRLNDDEKSSGDIEKEVYDSFNDPSKYFYCQSPVRVGKNIELKNFGYLEKEERRLNSMRKKNNDYSVTEKSYTATKSIINKQNNNIVKKNTDNIKNNNYELVDNNILKNIYDSYRKESAKRYNNNKNNSSENNNSNSDLKHRNSIINFNDSKSINIIDNDEINNLPINLSQSLSYQNRILNIRNNTDKDVKKMSRFISKKINSDEKDLMINKVDLYKLKKEILKEISDDHHYDDDLYEKFRWNINLRRPEKFHGIRMSYVNINSDRNPFWKVVVDKAPVNKELALKPNFNLNNKEFIKFANTKDIKKNIGKIQNLKNLDDLSIKGSNLLDFEYKREMSCKGKKILHKVFIENGKVILEQDINNVFGDETLYKSYDKRKSYSGRKNKNISKIAGDNLDHVGQYRNMTIPNEN